MSTADHVATLKAHRYQLAAAGLADKVAAIDAGIAALEASKPESAEAACLIDLLNRVARHVRHDSELWQEVMAAIIQLGITAPPRPEASAPQPPAEAQAQGGGEVVAQFYVSDRMEELCPIAGMEPGRIRELLGNGTHDLIVRTAPQQASAPVGVEAGRIASDVMFGWRLAQSRVCEKDACRLASNLQHKALAQQPAAVDEATRRDAERYRYLRRPEAWKEDHITEGGASAIFIADGRRGKAKDGEALDAAIDRILAGQQQGGPQE